jgi:hypothetical protein
MAIEESKREKPKPEEVCVECACFRYSGHTLLSKCCSFPLSLSWLYLL